MTPDDLAPLIDRTVEAHQDEMIGLLMRSFADADATRGQTLNTTDQGARMKRQMQAGRALLRRIAEFALKQAAKAATPPGDGKAVIPMKHQPQRTGT